MHSSKSSLLGNIQSVAIGLANRALPASLQLQPSASRAGGLRGSPSRDKAMGLSNSKGKLSCPTAGSSSSTASLGNKHNQEDNLLQNKHSLLSGTVASGVSDSQALGSSMLDSYSVGGGLDSSIMEGKNDDDVLVGNEQYKEGEGGGIVLGNPGASGALSMSRKKREETRLEGSKEEEPETEYCNITRPTNFKVAPLLIPLPLPLPSNDKDDDTRKAGEIRVADHVTI
jgi:hypothetical protein